MGEFVGYLIAATIGGIAVVLWLYGYDVMYGPEE